MLVLQDLVVEILRDEAQLLNQIQTEEKFEPIDPDLVAGVAHGPLKVVEPLQLLVIGVLVPVAHLQLLLKIMPVHVLIVLLDLQIRGYRGQILRAPEPLPVIEVVGDVLQLGLPQRLQILDKVVALVVQDVDGGAVIRDRNEPVPLVEDNVRPDVDGLDHVLLPSGVVVLPSLEDVQREDHIHEVDVLDRVVVLVQGDQEGHLVLLSLLFDFVVESSLGFF